MDRNANVLIASLSSLRWIVRYGMESATWWQRYIECFYWSTITTLTVGATGSYGFYPDGPDIVTICATPVGATGSINARLSWTEAQA